MTERLAAAGSGAPTCYAGDRALHSRYNPAEEAEKYIAALQLRGGIRYFILIEPGLGYCVPVLRRLFPGAKIIALHVSAFFCGPAGNAPAALRPDARWGPSGGTDLRSFLAAEIPDVEARAVKIIEWRPSLGAYGPAYLDLLAETAAFIKEIDANARTVRGFGRRWFKNFFKNITRVKKALRCGSLDTPWLIAGAGPSLEEAIPVIKKQRERGPLFILGVSSSVPALYAGGLKPDLVLATDGGGWALFHLYEALRLAVPALAISLNAALPSQGADLPVLLLDDGSLWQRLILKNLGVPSLSLPQRGTVTAAALDLAFRITRGKVFFTGMDLVHRDIKTHARPYSFDRLQEESATRFRPRYSQAYTRSAQMNGAGNNALYAAWFARQLASYPKRLYSLGNNHPLFAALPSGFDLAEDIPGDRGSGGAGGQSGPAHPGFIPVSLPGQGAGPAAVQTLMAALESPPFFAGLCRELGPLLLPGTEAPNPRDLAEEIRSLAGPYCGGTDNG
jgi:hypothetical protein